MPHLPTILDAELVRFGSSGFTAINEEFRPKLAIISADEAGKDSLFHADESQSSAVKETLEDLGLTADSLAQVETKTARVKSDHELDEEIGKYVSGVVDEDLGSQSESDGHSLSQKADQYNIDTVLREAEDWYEDKDDRPPFTIHIDSRANGVGNHRTVLSTDTEEEVEITFRKWLSSGRGY